MAGLAVTNGTPIACSFGTLPGVLKVLPAGRPLGPNGPLANALDFKPGINIAPFPMCTSILNPAVSTATTAAGGVLTPALCTPIVPAPWLGTSTSLVGLAPALTMSSKCTCVYGGVISIVAPTQGTVVA